VLYTGRIDIAGRTWTYPGTPPPPPLVAKRRRRYVLIFGGKTRKKKRARIISPETPSREKSSSNPEIVFVFPFAARNVSSDERSYELQGTPPNGRPAESLNQ